MSIDYPPDVARLDGVAQYGAGGAGQPSKLKCLLVCIGSFGELYPLLGIGRALAQRGHEVLVVANPFYEQQVRELGFGFAPLGSVTEMDEYLSNPSTWHLWSFWKVSMDYCALRTMRPLFQTIRELWEPGRSIVVGPGWAFGARLAQEKLGVPLVTIHLEPYLIRTLHDTPKMAPPMLLRAWVPRSIKRLQFWIGDRWFIDRLLAPATNAFRRELGLRPESGFMGRWWHSPEAVAALWPDWFYRPQPDWPAQVNLCGFPLWDGADGSPLPEDVARFLDAGEAPVIFTPGTLNKHARTFFAAAVDACRRLKLRGMLISRYRELLPEALPGGVEHFSHVPFGRLLPRARAIVHHGGTGTSALALAAGLPQVVIPLSFSQPDIAARLVSLGVAREVRMGWSSGRRLANALQHVLTSPDVGRRCRELAGHVRHSDAFDSVADVVMEAMNRRRGQPAAAE
jgi:rhamnosyltransferase subunit B